jgi:uncharacterized protein YjbK
MENRELEIKIDLQSESNYRKLLTRFRSAPNEIKQDNYFFDTPDHILAQTGWALRIRIEASHAAVTLKGKSVKSNLAHLADRPEYTTELPLQKALEYISNGFNLSDLPDEFMRPLIDIHNPQIVTCQLRFVNFRHTIDYETASIRLPLEIDRTIFPDNSIDYELEIELAGPEQYPTAISAISNLLDELSIAVIYQTEGKLSRALRKPAPE